MPAPLRRAARGLGLVTVALVAMAGCVASGAPAQVGPTVRTGDPPAPTATRPAHGGLRDQYAVWSPDGTMLAFTTNPGGGGQIWTTKADRTGEPRLLIPAIATQPAWSRDGRRLAFTSFRLGNWDIYVKDLESGAETRVTTDPSPDYSAAWSPDGSRLVFYRFDEAARRGSIVVAALDGSGERVLAAAGNESVPQWSPDGTRIVFQSLRDGNWEVYVMAADGSAQTRLTATPDRHEGEPSWTPDSGAIVFSAGSGRARDIYLIRADGSGERRLTRLQRELWGPRLSPDGTRLTFFEFPDGRIYLANADGTEVTALFGP